MYMTKPNSIQTKNDLPGWFNLTKYNRLRDLSEPELYMQVTWRAFVMNSILEKECSRSFYWPEEILPEAEPAIEQCRPIIQNIRENGLHNVKQGESKRKSPKEERDRDFKFRLSGAVGYLTVSNALMMSRYLLRKCPKVMTEFKKNRYLSGSDIEMLSVDAALRETVFSDNKAHITLDLGRYSDKSILRQLEKILPLIRDDLGIKEISKSQRSKALEVEKILRYNTLPYLDLTAWAVENKKKIPLRVMSSVLFPDGDKGDNDVQNIIIPLAKKIITEEFLDDWIYRLH